MCVCVYSIIWVSGLGARKTVLVVLCDTNDVACPNCALNFFFLHNKLTIFCELLNTVSCVCQSCVEHSVCHISILLPYLKSFVTASLACVDTSTPDMFT